MSRQATYVKPIHNDAEHAAALKMVDELWDKAIPGTKAGDTFELLCMVIEDYEKKKFRFDEKYDPIDVIKFWMEQNGLSRKDLIPFIGHRGRVAEVLNRKRPLSIEMIRNLSKAGIPAEMLVGEIQLAGLKSKTLSKKKPLKAASNHLQA